MNRSICVYYKLFAVPAPLVPPEVPTAAHKDSGDAELEEPCTVSQSEEGEGIEPDNQYAEMEDEPVEQQESDYIPSYII